MKPKTKLVITKNGTEYTAKTTALDNEEKIFSENKFNVYDDSVMQHYNNSSYPFMDTKNFFLDVRISNKLYSNFLAETNSDELITTDYTGLVAVKQAVTDV